MIDLPSWLGSRGRLGFFIKPTWWILHINSTSNFCLFETDPLPASDREMFFFALERQFIEFIEREQDHGETRQNQQRVRDHSHALITACFPAGFKAGVAFPSFGQRPPRHNAPGN